MSQLFTYDVATLIELIDSKTYLRDKTSDIYKDKIEKPKAWREFFCQCHHMSLMDFVAFPSIFVTEV
jgi:hypothetical protein